MESDRGPWVQALLASGYVVFAINPMQVACHWERHSASGAKSDAADAHQLAEIVRLDRAHRRPIAGDAEIAEHVKIATRAHQTMIWSQVRQVNALRSLLREYYPATLAAFGTDLASRDALAVLSAALRPDLGRRLSEARIQRGGSRPRTPRLGPLSGAHRADHRGKLLDLAIPQLWCPVKQSRFCLVETLCRFGVRALPHSLSSNRFSRFHYAT
jgi:hypothetical protein